MRLSRHRDLIAPFAKDIDENQPGRTQVGDSRRVISPAVALASSGADVVDSAPSSSKLAAAVAIMDNSKAKTSPRYRAPALEKGLAILELLARAAIPMTLSEISENMGRSKNELFRMLQVLEGHGYLTRADGTDAYMLTNRLFMLGMERPPVKGLMEVAMPVMHQLAEDTLQPCQLVVPCDEFIVVIARVDSPGDVGFVVRLGHRRPIPHATSGLVLMAFQTEHVRDRWIAMLDAKSVRYDRKHVMARLEAIRAQGHACIASELVAGITDLSAPILEHGVAVAALTVPFAERRSAKVGQKESVKFLVKAAARISSALSYGGA